MQLGRVLRTLAHPCRTLLRIQECTSTRGGGHGARCTASAVRRTRRMPGRRNACTAMRVKPVLVELPTRAVQAGLRTAVRDGYWPAPTWLLLLPLCRRGLSGTIGCRPFGGVGSSQLCNLGVGGRTSGRLLPVVHAGPPADELRPGTAQEWVPYGLRLVQAEVQEVQEAAAASLRDGASRRRERRRQQGADEAMYALAYISTKCLTICAAGVARSRVLAGLRGA
jgi:hypothetical protein